MEEAVASASPPSQLQRHLAPAYSSPSAPKKKGRPAFVWGGSVYQLQNPRFRHATADTGMDVILDMVGGDYLPKNMDLLREEGRLVYINAVNGSRYN